MNEPKLQFAPGDRIQHRGSKRVATVLEILKIFGDHYEYLVMPDGPLVPGGRTEQIVWSPSNCQVPRSI